MRFFVMFVTAVCVLFLIKLRWPKKKNSYKYLPVLIPSQPGIHATPDERIHFKKAILWVFLSCLLRCCYSFLSIIRKLSDYLYKKKTFYWLLGEFTGNLCIAARLHITVTWSFPKGNRYIQVWLYFIYILRKYWCQTKQDLSYKSNNNNQIF